MEWDNLRYILAIVRGQGITKAARQLKVHHSIVCLRLNVIEKRALVSYGMIC